MTAAVIETEFSRNDSTYDYPRDLFVQRLVHTAYPVSAAVIVQLPPDTPLPVDPLTRKQNTGGM
jgi:hypothetical protein